MTCVGISPEPLDRTDFTEVMRRATPVKNLVQLRRRLRIKHQTCEAAVQAAFGRRQVLDRETFRDFMIDHGVSGREAYHHFTKMTKHNETTGKEEVEGGGEEAPQEVTRLAFLKSLLHAEGLQAAEAFRAELVQLLFDRGGSAGLTSERRGRRTAALLTQELLSTLMQGARASSSQDVAALGGRMEAEAEVALPEGGTSKHFNTSGLPSELAKSASRRASEAGAQSTAQHNMAMGFAGVSQRRRSVSASSFRSSAPSSCSSQHSGHESSSLSSERSQSKRLKIFADKMHHETELQYDKALMKVFCQLVNPKAGPSHGWSWRMVRLPFHWLNLQWTSCLEASEETYDFLEPVWQSRTAREGSGADSDVRRAEREPVEEMDRLKQFSEIEARAWRARMQLFDKDTLQFSMALEALQQSCMALQKSFKGRWTRAFEYLAGEEKTLTAVNLQEALASATEKEVPLWQWLLCDCDVDEVDEAQLVEFLRPWPAEAARQVFALGANHRLGRLLATAPPSTEALEEEAALEACWELRRCGGGS
eukprot:g15631.t2